MTSQQAKKMTNQQASRLNRTSSFSNTKNRRPLYKLRRCMNWFLTTGHCMKHRPRKVSNFETSRQSELMRSLTKGRTTVLLNTFF
jgi:hypothetical protein